MKAGDALITTFYDERVTVSFPISGMDLRLVSPNSSSGRRYRPEWAGFEFRRNVPGGPLWGAIAMIKGPLIRRDGTPSPSLEGSTYFSLPGEMQNSPMPPEILELFLQAKARVEAELQPASP